MGSSTQESEVQLLQDAKRFTEQIQEQQFHLQQADNFPQAFTTEVSKMREQLLKYLVAQSCLTLCDPMDYSPPGFSVHGDSPGKNTGVGCHALL